MTGNPVIQFRVPPDIHSRLAQEGNPNAVAKRIVTEYTSDVDTVTLHVEQIAGKVATVEVNSGKTVVEKAEDDFAAVAALRREWLRLATDFPAQAREYGSFEEYERRHRG